MREWAGLVPGAIFPESGLSARDTFGDTFPMSRHSLESSSRPVFAALVACAVAGLAPLVSGQEEEGGSGSSIGDLLKKVKDIKVPESVSGLPEQIEALRKSYLETAETVEELRVEVDTLRQEVYDLRKQNEQLAAAVGEKVKADGLTALMKPTEIAATELVGKFTDDRPAAEESYRGRYLKVVGIVDRIETGARAIELFLRADGQDAAVRCLLDVGPDFYVEALPSQGRLISSNDRRTLLSVGQPASVIGTCEGFSLNVEMVNCRIEGLEEKRAATNSPR